MVEKWRDLVAAFIHMEYLRLALLLIARLMAQDSLNCFQAFQHIFLLWLETSGFQSDASMDLLMVSALWFGARIDEMCVLL